jgi:hypothetical protein
MKSVFCKLSLVGVLISATCTFAEADYYKKGIEFGKKTLQNMSQTASAATPELDVMDTAVVELTTTLYRENPSAEAHKRAFKNFKEYQKGVKESLAVYVSTGKNDPETKMKDCTVKMLLEIADAVVSSADYATMRTNTMHISSKFFKEMETFAPKLPTIKVTVDLNHALYKEGYAAGKTTGEWIVLEAQGKIASAEEQTALQKRIQTSLMNAFKAGTSQEDMMKGNFQFISGMKKALEEVNVESVLQHYKTPQEQAEKIRIEYKVALQGMQAGIEAMTNPQKGIGAIGNVISETAKELQATDTNAPKSQKTA